MAGAYYDMLARIGADISDFSRKMSQVTSKINEVARSAKGPLIGAGALLAPGAIPMVASLGAAAVAMGGSFAAAGLSIGAFGAVATTTLGSVFEAQKKAAEAQKELNAATTDKEKEAALKKMEEAYAGLSDKQKEAAKSLQEFKTFWSDFAKQFETPVIDVFTKSLAALKGIISPMAPAIGETAVAFSRLLDMLNQSLNAQPVKDFFEFLGNTAYERTMNFGMMFGNVIRGVMALMIAFDPLAANIENGLVNMTASFAKWAEGLANSKGFENFINYVKTNGPVLMSTLGNIGGIIKQVIVALAPFGAQVLSIVESFTAWVNKTLEANPILMQISGILAGLGAAFLVLAPVISTVVGAFSTFIGWLAPLFAKVDGTAKGITMLRTAFTFLTGSIGIIIGVITVLAAIFVKLWQTNEEFRTKVIEIWSMISSFIMVIVSEIVSVVMQIWGQLKSFWDQNHSEIMATAQVIWSLISNVINNQLRLIAGVFRAIFPVLKSIVSGTFSVIRSVISTILSVCLGIVKLTMALIRGDWSAAWSAIREITSSITNGIRNLVQTSFNALKNIVKSIMESLRGVVESGWRKAQSFLEGIDLTSIGSNIIQGLISGIKSMAGGVAEAVSSVVSGIKEKIQSALSIHSPSRWMRDMIGVNMGKGWIQGIEAMRGKIQSMTATMTEWMQPTMPNVQIGYNVPSMRGGSYAGATLANGATGNNRGDTTVNVYARTVDMDESGLMRALRRAEVLYG